MIAIKLKGGLGNQMFQYAYGRNLSIQQKETLVLDKSFLNNLFWQKIIGVTPRKYEMGEFNIKAKLTNKNNKNCLDGYWQNEIYFKDIRKIILNDFSLKKESSNFKKLKNIILNTNAISVHIRRGDYAKRRKTKKYHGLLPLKYYQKAVSYIIKKINNPYFYVFSDDIDWVKTNFKTSYPTHFVSQPNKLTNAEELILMSCCRHNIIANSSFSWWGAWLNKNPSKIIIAPRKWFRKEASFREAPCCLTRLCI